MLPSVESTSATSSEDRTARGTHNTRPVSGDDTPLQATDQPELARELAPPARLPRPPAPGDFASLVLIFAIIDDRLHSSFRVADHNRVVAGLDRLWKEVLSGMSA